MHRTALALLLLCALPAAVAQPAPAAPDLDQQLALLLAWFPGEWDNHEQHWQQATVEKREKPIERIHHVFVPVSVPAIGEHVFFVRQTLDDDPAKVYRQRLYAFSKNAARGAIQLTIYSFKDEKAYADAWREPALLDGLSRDALETRAGCEVYWTLKGDHFEGSMDADACRFVSSRLGKEIIINDTLRLSPDELWISDVAKDAEGKPVFGNLDGIPHKNRKVRYFEGWAAIKRGGKDAPPDSTDWIGMRGIVLHNEGDRVQVVDSEGKPVGYTIELARLTYQNTNTPILKLAVIDDATGKSVAYTWSEPNGTRLGINLGWFQTGVAQRRERVHFGW
jgi:hypothetical protein